MSKKGLKIVLPSAVTDSNLRKLEHYYGIEFTRGASDGGGNNGYHKLIGDESLLKEMRFHNQIKITSIKDAEVGNEFNQTNWKKYADGTPSVIDGTDDADIMQLHTVSVYAIVGGTNPTYERFIVSDHPFSYDGDEAVEYGVYAESPDYATVLNGALRSIRNEGVSGSAGAGYGTNYSDSQYGTTNAGGFPRTLMSRFQYEDAARAKNEDPQSNLPYIMSCHQDIELTQAFLYIEFRTKQVESLLGYGISTRAIPNASTWGKVTGVRMTADNGASYTYGGLGQRIYTDAIPAGMTMYQAINSNNPLFKMFEAQLAVSNGDTLEPVKNSDGELVQGLADGVMTGIWTKRFSFQINGAITLGGEQKQWTVEVVLRVPVWRGRTRLWGHLAQWTTGYELLNYYDGANTIHKVFRAPSVKDILVGDTDVATKTAEGQYAFESEYDYIGDMAKIGTTDAGGWAKEIIANGGISTPFAADAQGTSINYEDACFWARAQNQQGIYSRRGVSFGGLADAAPCGLRYAIVYSEPSVASTSRGCGFRVQLD